MSSYKGDSCGKKWNRFLFWKHNLPKEARLENGRKVLVFASKEGADIGCLIGLGVPSENIIAVDICKDSINSSKRIFPSVRHVHCDVCELIKKEGENICIAYLDFCNCLNLKSFKTIRTVNNRIGENSIIGITLLKGRESASKINYKEYFDFPDRCSDYCTRRLLSQYDTVENCKTIRSNISSFFYGSGFKTKRTEYKTSEFENDRYVFFKTNTGWETATDIGLERKIDKMDSVLRRAQYLNYFLQSDAYSKVAKIKYAYEYFSGDIHAKGVPMMTIAIQPKNREEIEGYRGGILGVSNFIIGIDDIKKIQIPSVKESVIRERILRLEKKGYPVDKLFNVKKTTVYAWKSVASRNNKEVTDDIGRNGRPVF